MAILAITTNCFTLTGVVLAVLGWGLEATVAVFAWGGLMFIFVAVNAIGWACVLRNHRLAE